MPNKRPAKFHEIHYGYKNCVKVDKKHKVIAKQWITGVKVHDSRKLKNPTKEGKDKIIYADAGYAGEEV